jgi:hypothetical protein
VTDTKRRQAAELKSKRKRKWYEATEPAEKITEHAVVISGIVVGQARTAKQREWFERAFGE